MKQKYAWCWIGLGTMLLCAALFLVFYNLQEDRKSGAAAAEALSALKTQITLRVEEEQQETTQPTQPGEDLYAEYETEDTTPPEQPVVELDGRLYVGILVIPSQQIELPVLRDWSYPNLRMAPCRYSGTSESGDLVIAAHNYRSHFGNLQSLNSGDQLQFIDVNGTVRTYEVTQTEMIGGRDIPAMLANAETDWDLTLFTCTLSGQSRVTVRAAEILES